MNKLQIQNLIDSYNGKNTSFLEGRKGLHKRIFNLQTKGIKDLSDYLKSDAVQDLGDKEEITGNNLISFLEIMENRDNRIFNTSRSYENDPEKSTNRIYDKLYHLLLADAVNAQNAADSHDDDDETEDSDDELAYDVNDEEDIPEVKNANKFRLEVIFARESKRELFHQMQSIKTNKIYILGKCLTTNTTYKPDNFETQLKDAQNDLSNSLYNNEKLTSAKLSYQGQIIHIVLTTIENAWERIVIIPKQISLGNNVKKALELYAVGSSNGDNKSSFELARYYAGASLPIDKPNRTKAIEFLKLAQDQGSEEAASILSSGEPFGKIKVPHPPKIGFSPR